jgi:hypothetical protein
MNDVFKCNVLLHITDITDFDLKLSQEDLFKNIRLRSEVRTLIAWELRSWAGWLLGW